MTNIVQEETFKRFCDDRGIKHWRVSFWHFCQAEKTQNTTEALAAAWDEFLTDTLTILKVTT